LLKLEDFRQWIAKPVAGFFLESIFSNRNLKKKRHGNNYFYNISYLMPRIFLCHAKSGQVEKEKDSKIF